MECNCLCHFSWLMSHPPRLAADCCNHCDCNKIKREKVMTEEKCEKVSYEDLSDVIEKVEQNVSPMVEKIQELEIKITRLFEEVRDIRELRYVNHQQIGCIEAKQNDSIHKLDVLWEAQADFSNKSWEKIKKLESENNHHCEAITVLERTIPDIKYSLHSSVEEIHSKLEGHENNVYLLTESIKDQEKRISSLEEQNKLLLQQENIVTPYKTTSADTIFNICPTCSGQGHVFK